MSFFSSSQYKPQIRQEGFSPTPATNAHTNGGGSPPPESIDSPTLNNNSPGGVGSGGAGGAGFNDLFSHSFLESASTNPNPNLRKYPSSSSGSSNDAGGTNMDFGEELASLMGSEDRSPQGQNHVQNQNQYAHNHHHQQDDGQQHRGYGPSAHGIFDASAMLPHGGAHPSSVSSTASLHSEYHGGGAYNSTLNSSIRYEAVPEAGSPALSSSTSGGNANPPPSAFHHFSAVTRHTPSPIHSSSMHSPSHSHSQIQGHSIARSRSRSRPPASTVGASSSSLGAGGVGPARTTRARRNNSVSGTSPPPAFGHHHHHGRPHPHAIVIPGSRSAAAAAAASGGAAGSGGGWFVSGQSSASEFSLPTPPSDVLHHSFGSLGNNNNFGSAHHHHPHPLSQHHSHSHSHSLGGQQYTPFSLSPPASSDHHTLPPVSSLHSPLSYSGGGGGPKSPNLAMDFSLNNFGASAGSGHTPLNLGGVTSSPMIASPLMTQGGFGGRGGNAGTGYVGSPSSLPSGSLASSSSTLTGLAGAPSGTTPNGSNNANANVAPSTTTSTAVGATAAAQDKQSLLANEKRRRRRESHNAVERRRRDNINEKISELATLIPECMLDAAAAGTGGGSPSAMAPSPGLLDDPLIALPVQESQPRKDSASSLVGVSVKEEQGGGDSPGGTTTTTKGGAGAEEGGVVKANKGMILRKSVEYIRYLQQLVTAQGARNRELERELSAYRGSSSNVNGGGSGGTPSDSEAGDAAHGSPPASSALRFDNREQPQDRDQEMMLHDGFGGMLPTMPEGEGEEEDGLGVGERGGDGMGMGLGMNLGMIGMDVDRSEGAAGSGKREERGRTRGVRRNGAGNANGSWPNLSLKEEDDGPDGLGFMHVVGMQT